VGRNFALGFERNSIKLLGITQKFIYCLINWQNQMDRQRGMIQEFGAIFEVFMDYGQRIGRRWLAIAEFSYNNKNSKSIKISPFYAELQFNS